MIRKALVTLAFVGIAALAVSYYYLRQPHGTIGCEIFEPRLKNVLQTGGFDIQEERTPGGDEVLPLPLLLRFGKSASPVHPGLTAAVGFPNATEQFQLTAGSSHPFEFSVRYLDGRAAAIAIHARAAEEPFAQTLRSALVREFPDLFVTLTLDGA